MLLWYEVIIQGGLGGVLFPFYCISSIPLSVPFQKCSGNRKVGCLLIDCHRVFWETQQVRQGVGQLSQNVNSGSKDGLTC